MKFKNSEFPKMPYQAWSFDDKKMYPIRSIRWTERGNVILDTELENNNYMPLQNCPACESEKEIIKFQLLEYTGFNDNQISSEKPNGNKLFEGDLVSVFMHHECNTRNGIILWSQEYKRFEVRVFNKGGHKIIPIVTNVANIRKIGSYFETPVLYQDMTGDNDVA